MSYARISQKVWSLRHHYFHVKAKILADFQICISVPLSLHPLWSFESFEYFAINFLNLLYTVMPDKNHPEKYNEVNK